MAAVTGEGHEVPHESSAAEAHTISAGRFVYPDGAVYGASIILATDLRNLRISRLLLLRIRLQRADTSQRTMVQNSSTARANMQTGTHRTKESSVMMRTMVTACTLVPAVLRTRVHLSTTDLRAKAPTSGLTGQCT